MKRVQRLLPVRLTDLTKEELIAIVLELRAQGHPRDVEHDALEDQLGVLRSCKDSHCLLCAECVVALFVKAHPAPLTIPRKYVETGAWRK